MLSQKYLAKHHSGGLRGLNNISRQEQNWVKKTMKMRNRGRKKNKKQRGRVNKKSPQWSWVMAGMRSCGTLHFTRRWDPHQPVSSGFTAMTLWWKPLCCLGCKLRVHTESWALTPKESNTLILCYFFFFLLTRQHFTFLLQSLKKGRQATHNVKSLANIRVRVAW